MAQNRITATLLTLMDGSSSDGKFVVLGATNRPDALDSALRRPGRFDREVEIGIPSPSSRVSILNALLSSTSHCLSVDEILEISSKTHGYVGADLAAVVREAGIHAIRRTVSSVDNLDTLLSSLQINELSKDPSLCISKKDVDLALLKVKPSAMREITLDIPKVSWSDIGGNEDVKQRIKEAVEWPLLNPDAFTRFNIKPPRGILLYGPPGCSKTLLAKAVASSGGLNFIAVKGPEVSLSFS
jgi:AAA family ATPase